MEIAGCTFGPGPSLAFLSFALGRLHSLDCDVCNLGWNESALCERAHRTLDFFSICEAAVSWRLHSLLRRRHALSFALNKAPAKSAGAKSRMIRGGWPLYALSPISLRRPSSCATRADPIRRGRWRRVEVPRV